MKKETVICPYCDKSLEVDGLYDFGLMCPECGGKIDVFRDEAVVIHTELGKIAMELPNGNGKKESLKLGAILLKAGLLKALGLGG